MPGPPAHYEDRTFANALADRTGLNSDVTFAWVLAEGGPAHNPLNIGPGKDFGSTSAALDATTKLILTSPNYAGIRNAAKTGDSTAELHAIITSPWDAGHYTAKTQGDKLLGAWARAKAMSRALHIPNPVDAVTKPVTDAVSGVENFVVDKATLGLAYVALTGLALGLLLVGAAGGDNLRRAGATGLRLGALAA